MRAPTLLWYPTFVLDGEGEFIVQWPDTAAVFCAVVIQPVGVGVCGRIKGDILIEGVVVLLAASVAPAMRSVLSVAARCTELPACPFIASSKSRLYRGVDHFHGVRSVMMCTASDENGDHIYILDKCVSGVLFTECSAV